MEKKMTSGEIAKKAGVSQKAIRLYDEKGLLKPSEYSEGNYRLYDKEALQVLEKILALKQIGFSLEEIHDNLIHEKDADITAALEQQLLLMEEQKRELEQTIGCIQNVLKRTEEKADWNSVAETTRMIQMDKAADERHFEALKHTADTEDWYVKIYKSLCIEENMRILDLGCGYGKLWRNNMDKIPQGVSVDGVDLHGSWADDFDNYLKEIAEQLPQGTEIALQWADVESDGIWEELAQKKPYTLIIAHYLLYFLKEAEILVARAAEILCKGGMFSCNGPEISGEHIFWQEALSAMKLKSDFIEKEVEQKQREREEFRRMLDRHFIRMESVKLANSMQYHASDELFERLCTVYPARKKYFAENKKTIISYFEELLARLGGVTIHMASEFWHCYKE